MPESLDPGKAANLEDEKEPSDLKPLNYAQDSELTITRNLQWPLQIIEPLI